MVGLKKRFSRFKGCLENSKMELNQALRIHGFKLTNSVNIKKAYLSYRKSTMLDIMDAYKKPSLKKILSFRNNESVLWHIVELTNSIHCDEVKVIHKGTSYYTMGLHIQYEGGNYFLYITPTKRWYTNMDSEI